MKTPKPKRVYVSFVDVKTGRVLFSTDPKAFLKGKRKKA